MGSLPKAGVAIVFASLIVSGGSACAVKPVEHGAEQCAVIGEQFLPAGVTPVAICDAIRTATRNRAPGIAYSVQVRVNSASSLSAIVQLPDGTTLAEQKLAVNDRQISSGSIDRFAATIATQIASAQR